MDLSEWQQRLEEHFQSIRDQREPDHPIFVLEHGLSDDEVARISTTLRSHLEHDEPSKKHFLPWAVHASEIGYKFAGDEYWKSFETSMSGWQGQWRPLIRNYFQRFCEEYGGAKPTGAWAGNRTIICWPITHAILPLDLQRQLAKAVFELRVEILPVLHEQPVTLGELIRNHCHRAGCPSRFKEITQQPQLIGQIAKALVLPKNERRTQALILPPTLARISEDLEKEKSSKAWLDVVKRKVKTAFNFSQPSGTHPKYEPEQRILRARSLEPLRVLRPSATNGCDWDVHVELPDFRPLLSLYPDLEQLLEQSRCQVKGSSGRPLARGSLCYGKRNVQLDDWPAGDQPLIEFIESGGDHKDSSKHLSGFCSLQPGPTWLFKIDEDGFATELRTRLVRPSRHYVIVQAKEFAVSESPTLRPTTLNCRNVCGLHLDVPDVITREFSQQLETLGLSQAGTIEVWPAGVTPVQWDGEGTAAWLSTDAPCIGLKADYPVDAFSLQLDSKTTKVAPPETGAPLFIAFENLAAGQHDLRISADTTREGASGDSTSLTILIRDPQTWRPDGRNPGALLVVVNPHAPTLEQIWDGNVDLEIRGPQNCQVVPTVHLYKKGATEPSLKRTLPPLSLPVDPDTWQRHLKEQLKNDETALHYELAHRGELCFRAEGGLGAYTLEVERESTPLRWVVSQRGAKYVLNAVDDTDKNSARKVFCCLFTEPDVIKSRPAENFFTSRGGVVEGGLWVVEVEDEIKSIVIPPIKVSLTSSEPELQRYRKDPATITRLIQVIDFWGRARCVGGGYSEYHRTKALHSLRRKLFQLLCGEDWGRVEDKLHGENRSVGMFEVRAALFNREEPKGFLNDLKRRSRRLSEQSPRERVRALESLAVTYLKLPQDPQRTERVVDSDETSGTSLIRVGGEGAQYRHWLVTFTLMLTSSPTDAVRFAKGKKNVEAAIQRLLQYPLLVRAARYMVLDQGFQVNRKLDKDNVRHSPEGASMRPVNRTWNWL